MFNKIEKVKELLEIQGSEGNWNCNSYMHGFYNGIELSLSVIENRDPIYRDAPEKFIDDAKKEKELLDDLVVIEENKEVKRLETKTGSPCGEVVLDDSGFWVYFPPRNSWFFTENNLLKISLYLRGLNKDYLQELQKALAEKQESESDEN